MREKRKIDKIGNKDEMFDLTMLNVKERYKASYKIVENQKSDLGWQTVGQETELNSKTALLNPKY